MVNRRISNPEHRSLNSKIAYHKRRALHFLELLVMNGEDPELQKNLDYHHLKVRELKLKRAALFDPL